MFTAFTQVCANRGDLWENARADQCQPETEGRGLHMVETNQRTRFIVLKTSIYNIDNTLTLFVDALHCLKQH